MSRFSLNLLTLDASFNFIFLHEEYEDVCMCVYMPSVYVCVRVCVCHMCMCVHVCALSDDRPMEGHSLVHFNQQK